MDAYDIFKKLTKGLTFPKKVLGIKNNDIASKLVPVKKEEEKVEIKKEDVESDIEVFSDKSGSVKSETDSDDQQSEDDLQLMEGVKVGEKKKKKKKEKSEDLKKKLELEEQNRFRNEHGIKTVGRHVPAALQDFSDLVNRYNVSQALIDVVKQCGYDEPTPVQRQAIPCMLEDRQILACAPTGSGKTAAFLVPILHALGAPQGGPRALILCPTRELAQQIYREVLRLSASTELRCSVVRNLKESKVKEREATIRKSDIVISTPNRLCYLLNQDNVNISLDKVSWLIIDEADKLFEGSAEQAADFRQQLEQVLAACGARRRRVAMFSATHTPALGKWARRLRGLINVTVGQRNAASSLVQQELQYCGSEGGKLLAFRQLLRAGLQPPVLVFVQSKERAKQLFKELIYDGINVDVIHADRTQQQRDNVVRSFRVGRVWVLICTELMARGVDFRGVSLVLNYDFPPSAIAYVHRVGRAGRAGQKGKAITFFTQDDIGNLRSIASVLVQSGCEVPAYMLQLKADRSRRRRAAHPPRRQDLTTILKRPDKRKLEDGKAASTDTTKVTPLVQNGKNKKHRRLQSSEQKSKQNIKHGNKQKGGNTNANHKLGGKDKAMKKKKKKMVHKKVKNNT